MTQTYHIVPLGDLRKGIETILAKKDGADYVQKLLDEAHRLFAKNYPHISTFWDGYEKITNAGGYQLDDSIPNGGTVKGDLFADGALPGTVYMAPWRSEAPPTASFIAMAEPSYAYRALHETFHLARQGGYSDREMALAGCSLAGKEPPNYPEADILPWSQKFDEFLVKHCPRD